jgi:hypothetical protein
MTGDLSKRLKLSLIDGRNHHAQAVWSRSGKHLILSLGNRLLDPYGQVSLDHEQVEEVAAFLAETLAPDAPPHPGLELIDDDAHELDLEWDRRGRRLSLVAFPVGNRLGEVIPRGELLRFYSDDPSLVQLSREQAEELAEFLKLRPEQPPAD